MRGGKVLAEKAGNGKGSMTAAGLETRPARRDRGPRKREADLLARCVAAGRSNAEARDRREANVFRLAAMVIQSRFPDVSNGLMRASERYFARRPGDRLPPAIVCERWLFGLPRLREMLTRRLLHGG